MSGLRLVFLLSSDEPKSRVPMAVEPSLCHGVGQDPREDPETFEETATPISTLHMRAVRALKFCSISVSPAANPPNPKLFNHFLHTLNTCRSLQSMRCSCNCFPHDFHNTAASHLLWSELHDPDQVVLARCFHCFVGFFVFCVFVLAICYHRCPGVPPRAAANETPPHHSSFGVRHRCWLLLSCPRRFQDHDAFTAERHVARVYCRSSPCRQRVYVLMDLHVKSKLSKTIRSDCHNSGAILAPCNPVLIASLGNVQLPSLTKNSPPSSATARQHKREMSNVTTDHDCLVLHTRT